MVWTQGLHCEGEETETRFVHCVLPGDQVPRLDAGGSVLVKAMFECVKTKIFSKHQLCVLELCVLVLSFCFGTYQQKSWCWCSPHLMFP